MDDKEFAAWNTAQRALIFSYLEKEGSPRLKLARGPHSKSLHTLVSGVSNPKNRAERSDGGPLLGIFRRTTFQKMVCATFGLA
jgi:hypothetical protein